ncbi:MAG: phosphoenolpyruvate--protein phosphotransferase [Halopseudomonas sp.]
MNVPSPPSLELLRQIVVDASRARGLEDQVDCIVRHVHQAVQVAVCSLYLLDSKQQRLRLISTIGLNPEVAGQLQLPIDKGLVGTIASCQLPLVLDQASRHPDYQYFPDSGEQQFDAFLGVPIVYMGETLGVLVLQDAPPRRFNPEDEAFLVTVSAQLASSLLSWTQTPPPRYTDPKLPRRINGINGAPGVAVGQLHIINSDIRFRAIDDHRPTEPKVELNRFRDAVAQTLEDLDAAHLRLQSSVADEVLEVFDFYKLMLTSNQLTSAPEQRIRNGESATSALSGCIEECALAFESMNDPYFRARGEDVRNIGNKLFNAFLGDRPSLPADCTDIVLTGELIGITDIAQFAPEQLAGIICMQGSALSHTALLACGLGIPAVMGTGTITGMMEGAAVAVDGHHGHVDLNPDPRLLQEIQQTIRHQQCNEQQFQAVADQPAETLDGFRVQLRANISLQADINAGLARGAEGVGLYRSEFPFMVHPNFPSEDEQYQNYRHLLESYYPNPVTIRTLDIGGDKPLPYFPFEEENPGLGWRGIRFSLDNRPIFMTQLRAMIRASADYNNLQILLPMVSRVDEVTDTLALLNTAMEQLRQEGITFDRPKLGIMIEVPAAIPLLPFFAPHIDFISIGSNDLSQYLLALDRNNPRVSARFDHLHPAVLHSLVALMDKARQLKLNVCLCGEMASDPLAVMLLLGIGLEELSMSSFNLPKIRYLIRKLNQGEAQQWLQQALLLDHEQQIRQLLIAALHERDLGELLSLGEPTD